VVATAAGEADEADEEITVYATHGSSGAGSDVWIATIYKAQGGILVVLNKDAEGLQ
jgi:hypothetical protein